MVAVVRMPSLCASRCTDSHSSDLHFRRAMRCRTSSSRISAPPPGIDCKPRVAQPRDRLANRQARNLGDAQNLRRGKTVQMHLRKALLNRPQHIFVPLDFQIRMQAALQQHARPAQLQHLLDLCVNRFERQHVAFLRAQRPVKRAERAILGAEIRVINVAVDLISGHARIRLLAAHFVRRHPDADQVIGVKKIQRFLLTDSHRSPPMFGRLPPLLSH